MVLKIIKDDENLDDFFHHIIESFLLHRSKTDHLEDKNKKYYFIRVVKNQYYSKTSPYYYRYKKAQIKREDLDANLYEIPDPETPPIPDLDWVKNTLNKLDWYERELFLLYLELGTMTKVSKKTTIPLNTVSRQVGNIKLFLKQTWNAEIG
jgi:DNA-directed RNA polymerase specialized sigma24 family protein